MKIVLIGAGGFLGKSLFERLFEIEMNAEWHLFSSSEKTNKNLDKCFYYTYKWPEHTLSDETYKNTFAEADVIIYAAGAGIQPGENADDDQIFNLNLYEPVRLSQLLVKLGFMGQFITFGSYFEIGKNQQQVLLDEQLFLGQSNELPNIYCRAKKELSHFHYVSGYANISFKWLHMVLTNIYGPGENENRLIPYIIKQAKNNLPLHFTSGSQIRQYTYIDDVVQVVSALLGKASGLYHITNENPITIKSIIDETVQQVKDNYFLTPQLHFDIAERRDTSMDYLAVSAQKLQNDWGLTCSTTLKQGVASYFTYEHY